MGVTRRLFLGGILASATAPAIVRASSLMPIWVPPAPRVLSIGELWSAQLASKFYDSAVFGENVSCAYETEAWRFGVDHGRPGGDMTAWTQWSRDKDGALVVRHINTFETYK